MVIVGHLVSFIMGKCREADEIRMDHTCLCVEAIDFPTASLLPAGNVEMIKAEEKWE
ncbi:MAG: hypothetical protein ACLR23_12060 [Clostridia bacterium]